MGTYPLPSASSKCDTLLLATKDCFIHKVNARAESYTLPAQGGAGGSPGTARCCATRAGSHMPVWTRAGFSHGSGRKCSHGVMQESSVARTASCSQRRRMHKLPMHQKLPSIQTGVLCNSASTLILSAATIWGAEGLPRVKGMCYKSCFVRGAADTPAKHAQYH